MSHGTAIGMATVYGLDDRGIAVPVPVRSRICTAPYRPDRLWGPPSLLATGYQGHFVSGEVAGE
jgi:hypothetical protein